MMEAALECSNVLTRAKLETLTDIDRAFPTAPLLPAADEIPEEFWLDSNLYNRIASAVFYRRALPAGEVEMMGDFTIPDVTLILDTHLGSWGQKHEHKIAGVAFMLSQMTRVEET